MQRQEQTVRVLLIDDDSEFVELYRMRLERDGYEVNWAHQGAEGLQMVRTWHPDLIFLDMRMPEMDGIEFLRQLRQDQVAAWLPVIALTNYSDDEKRKQARDLGALEWVLKTDTTPRTLADHIRHWLAGSDREE